jgi:hypothetical protein
LTIGSAFGVSDFTASLCVFGVPASAVGVLQAATANSTRMNFRMSGAYRDEGKNARRPKKRW